MVPNYWSWFGRNTITRKYFLILITPKGGHFAVLGGVLLGAVGSAVVGTLILKARPIDATGPGVEDEIEVNVPTAE